MRVLLNGANSVHIHITNYQSLAFDVGITAVSHLSGKLAIGLESEELSVHTTDGAPLLAGNLSSDRINGLACRPDGKLLAVISPDRSLRLYPVAERLSGLNAFLMIWSGLLVIKVSPNYYGQNIYRCRQTDPKDSTL